MGRGVCVYRNSHMSALGRFGAFALVGIILASLLATNIRADGPIEATPSNESSTDYAHYVITDNLPALIPSASPVASVEKSGVDIISLTESFDEPQFDVKDNFDTIEISGCGTTSSPGEPTVPAKTIFVLLPPDRDVLSVEVEPARQVPIERELYLYPGQEPVPIGTSSPEFTQPDEEVYSSLAPYPSEELCELEFVTSYRGYRLAVMRLFPVQYVPAERRAVFYPELEVRVGLKPASEAGLAFRPTADVEEWVKTHVKNPEFIASYDSQTLNGDAEYLIITRPMFLSALQPLVDLKSQRMTVKVVTVDNIITSYSGRDVPERMRNCIIDHYQNHGTQWVLLAGDADYYDLATQSTPNYVLDKPWELPVRYVWNPDYPDQDYTGVNWRYRPTDYYYADLDGTWDDDNDNRFGERASDSIVDEVEWFADVYVGRMPAREESTMQAIVQKTVNYQPRQPEICLFGANLFDDYEDGKTLKQYIKENYIPIGVDNEDIHEYYSKDGTLSYDAFLDAVNSCDPTIINAAGHGNPSGIYYMGNPFADTGTPGLITNSGFSMFAMSCLTNAFDIQGTCLGEAMLQDPDGGAIGYMGDTRVGWGAYGPDFLTWGSNGQDVKFFEEVFQNCEIRQGAALYKAKMDYIESGWYWDFELLEERCCLFVGMLLGDPELFVLSENQPFSSVKPIEPYWRNEEPFVISAGAYGVYNIENVALWYRYSNDQSNWSDWQEFGVDEEKPWEWSFDAPEGDGYYEFYSIAIDREGNVEEPPEIADACAGVDRVPPSGVLSLTRPENDALITTCVIDFSWSSVEDDLSGGVTYTLILDNEPTLSEPLVLVENNLHDNSFTVVDAETLPDGTIYWRVCAVDIAGNASDWSEGWQFTLLAPPPTPDMISPENEALVHDDTPTFKWSSVYDFSGVTYTLQYSTDPTFETGTVTVDINVSGDLDHDGDVDEDDYWIFVAAFGHSIGDPAYNLEADYDGDGTVTLVDYQIWLGYYRDFTENGVTYTVPDENALDEDVHYYWRVRAVDGVGNVGEWSDTWRFIIDLSMIIHTTTADFESGTLENLSASGDEVRLAMPLLAWSRTYDDVYGTPTDITVDPFNNIYITGFGGQFPIYDWLTVKYDENGDILWTQLYDNDVLDQAMGIATDSSGNVYVTGYSLPVDASGKVVCVTIKYYGENGDIAWVRTQDNHYGYEVAVDSSGYVYVAGRKNTNQIYLFIIKYDEDGNEIWVQYHDFGNVEVSDIGIAVDSMPYMDIIINAFTIQYNGIGAEGWSEPYGSGDWQDSRLADIVVANDDVYVTGYSRDSPGGWDWDWLTVKYGSRGELIWESTYNYGTSSEDFARGIAVDSSGNVYVTGYIAEFEGGWYSPTKNYCTMKYGPDGNLLWSDVIESGEWGGDRAEGVAVDSSNNVYVTGRFNDYYHTIKYQQPSSGTLTSADLISNSKYIPSATAIWNADVPEGTSLEVEISNDGGSTWYAVENGETITFPEPGQVLRYRVTFSTTDDTKTPVLYDITLNTIDNISPPAPTLISPPNGVFIGDNTPTFRWTAVSDPSGVTYTLQYSKGENFQEDINGDLDHDGDVDEDDYQIFRAAYGHSIGDPAYNPEADYDGTGTVGQGDYQIWRGYYWDFIETVTLVEGITPNGDLDHDGDVDNDDYQIFRAAYGHSIGDPAYNPEADYDGTGTVGQGDYQIWRGYYWDFQNGEITYTVPSENALPNGRYYWRVRAVDGAGNIGGWSDVWWFKLFRLERTLSPEPAEFIGRLYPAK